MTAAQEVEAEDRCSAVAQIGKVLLTVTSDAACKLSVNREPHGTLTANQPQTVMVDAEEQVVECTAPDRSEGARDTRLLGGGCGSVEFTVAELWRRFKTEKSGTVRDTATGLLWQASDNGRDTDWASAKKHCQDQGARLPSNEELKAIHDESGALFTPCGDASCRASRKLRLSGRFFWSSSTFETEQVLVVGLTGDRPTVQSVEPITAKDIRALCVLGS